MLGGQTAMYGLNLQTRCLAPQLGQNEKHRFLVGTVSARQDNEVNAHTRIIKNREYNNDSNNNNANNNNNIINNNLLTLNKILLNEVCCVILECLI